MVEISDEVGLGRAILDLLHDFSINVIRSRRWDYTPNAVIIPSTNEFYKKALGFS